MGCGMGLCKGSHRYLGFVPGGRVQRHNGLLETPGVSTGIIRIHTYIHTYIPTYLPTYLRTYIHTYIHTYIYIYIYILNYIFISTHGASMSDSLDTLASSHYCEPRFRVKGSSNNILLLSLVWLQGSELVLILGESGGEIL